MCLLLCNSESEGGLTDSDKFALRWVWLSARALMACMQQAQVGVVNGRDGVFFEVVQQGEGGLACLHNRPTVLHGAVLPTCSTGDDYHSQHQAQPTSVPHSWVCRSCSQVCISTPRPLPYRASARLMEHKDGESPQRQTRFCPLSLCRRLCSQVCTSTPRPLPYSASACTPTWLLWSGWGRV